MEALIKEIHAQFDTASDRLLADAKEIISSSFVPDHKKVARLKAIGFTSAGPIDQEIKAILEKEKAVAVSQAIEYYTIHYPGQKFITDKEIEKLCKKYNLVYGPAQNYLGDIPEKNLLEIEEFQLRNEDCVGQVDIYEAIDTFSRFLRASMLGRNSFGIVDEREDNTREFGFDFAGPQKSKINSYSDRSKTKNVKPAFKIYAPSKDFNTTDYAMADGYKLVPEDPIVIQPVRHKTISGGLIISKWGLEGKDQSLTNETMN